MIPGIPDYFTIPAMLLCIVLGWGLIGAIFGQFNSGGRSYRPKSGRRPRH